VASAFVSYAHEDQEFVLALVERLQTQGLEIRYDQVALRIGDSLIRAIAEEISEGDFLIAVVSPDSVESEWCQTELALAKTQGISERRVKVLPVRFRGVGMPPMLQDTLWGDADIDDVETLARRLAAAMRANLEGREAEAAREAREAQKAPGQPAHAEVAGDVGVVQIEEVAQRVWDVFAAWAPPFNGPAIVDAQRRLRWSLDGLPDRVRIALRLVEQLANADLDDLLNVDDPEEVERDIRDEMRSVRTQVAQGLPVTRRWAIAEALGPVSAGSRDAVSYLWEIGRGEETRRIQVYISGSAMASQNAYLPGDVVQAKETDGRSVVTTLLALDDPPKEVLVTTAGISLTLPD
jgi:hypothetical protein